MAVNPSVFGPCPQFETTTGVPAVGTQLFFYVAGSTSTKQNTYTDSTGAVANPNPIILNSLGQPTNEIWWTNGMSYKVVWAPATDTDPPTNPIRTWDNLRGINDTTLAATQSEWVLSPLTPTFVSSTSFTLTGNQTATFNVGRRLQTTNTGGTVYSTIKTSVFTTVTTVTVVNTLGVLDSGLSAVSYGILSNLNTSEPAGVFEATRIDVASAATTDLTALAPSSRNINITGTTTITAFTIASGQLYFVRFNAALTLTNNGSIVTQTGANITTAAGDTCVIRATADNVVEVLFYSFGVARSWQVQRYTPVATTSGTSIDPFSGVTIPTWAKRITLTLNAVSQATGDFFVVRLGTASGIVSSGYAAGWSSNGTSGNNITGFEFEGRVDAASAYTGKVVYELQDASTNTWVAAGNVYAEGSDTFISAGRVSLTGLLTQMRLTTLTAVTLDAGSISVMVEG